MSGVLIMRMRYGSSDEKTYHHDLKNIPRGDAS